MKKLVLCALLICAACVGCGGDEKKSPSGSGSTASSS
jgi:hypothetical protein